MKAVLALSGGLDSTTILAHLLSQGVEVECFGFEYGSKHNPFELPCAEGIARHYGVPFQRLDLSFMKRFRSNLLASGGDIPEGHYESPSMALTVVPGRNIIFLSILAGVAWSRGASHVALGVHQGDHAIYEDCRVEFCKAMDSALYLGTGGRVELITPFLRLDKAGIVRRGLELGVPYTMTRTCYKAQEKACGKCGSCQERLEAFAKNSSRDPIMYEA